MDTLALERDLDRRDFREHLHAALDLRRLRRLVAEPVDELPDPGDLLVLPLLLLSQCCDPRVSLDQILAVGADVWCQRPQPHFSDACHDAVQEIPVVRHQDERVWITGQEVFEPVARLEVEMVRWLVEQHDMRLTEDELRQGDPHLPTAREGVGRFLELIGGEPEPAEHAGDLQIDGVAVLVAELVLQFAVAAPGLPPALRATAVYRQVGFSSSTIVRWISSSG